MTTAPDRRRDLERLERRLRYQAPALAAAPWLAYGSYLLHRGEVLPPNSLVQVLALTGLVPVVTWAWARMELKAQREDNSKGTSR